jgi:hypothetical protein
MDPRVTSLARLRSNCTRKLQTHPLVREGTPQQEIRKCMTVIKILSWPPDGGLTPRQTDRLTIGRNITSTSAQLGRYSDGLRIGYPGFCFQQRQEIFLHSAACRPDLGLIQIPIQWVLGTLSPGVKLPVLKLTTHLYVVLWSRIVALCLHGVVLSYLNTGTPLPYVIMCRCFTPSFDISFCRSPSHTVHNTSDKSLAPSWSLVFQVRMGTVLWLCEQFGAHWCTICSDIKTWEPFLSHTVYSCVCTYVHHRSTI